MKVILEMQLEFVSRVCNYVLESCVRVAPRRPLAMAAALPRSGADCHGCGVHTRHQKAMGDAAEPANEKTPKCRKRDREGEGESDEASHAGGVNGGMGEIFADGYH